MNRAERGPMLLIVAGALLLLAVVAYLIKDARDESRRVEAAFDRQTLDTQTQRSIAVMRAIRDQGDQTRQEGVSIRDQHEEILKSLGRIERMLRAARGSHGR